MATSVERAVQNAIAARLAARLPGVKVVSGWPDDFSKLTDRAISVLTNGARIDELLQVKQVGQDNIHDDMPTRVSAPAAVDLPTAIVALNEFKARWNAHNASATVHLVADATNVVTAPNASNLSTALALAVDALAKFGPHIASTTYHEVADSKSGFTTPTPVDLGTLVAAAELLRTRGNQHFVARLYHWRLRDCELPLQLDIWCTHNAARDELVAALESELNCDATAAGLDGGDPARNGLLVDVGDGHPIVADCMFRAPILSDDAESARTGDWRATYLGTADFTLVVKAQTSRIARIVLRQTISEGSGIGLAPSTASVSYAAGSDPVESLTG